MTDRPPPHVLELLDWIATRARTYDETMSSWRTSCPRLSAWEDAIAAGLVAVERRNGVPTVVLTDHAKSALAR